MLFGRLCCLKGNLFQVDSFHSPILEHIYFFAFFLLFPPLNNPSMLGASHISACLFNWPETSVFIIGGNHHTLRGSALYDVIRLHNWL